MAGAISGSRLPRKSGTNKKTREAIENVAFEIGIVIAIERNRFRMNQTELAEQVGGGADQSDISRIERGKPTGFSNAQMNKLFRILEMEEFQLQRRFLKWWQGT
jgi:ribosome-binding protein aMBF1 (putative translation factor)